MGSGPRPGVQGADGGVGVCDGGTLIRSATPAPGVTGTMMIPYTMTGGGTDPDDLSFEADGAPYTTVSTPLVGLTAPQMRVLAMLRQLKPDIAAAEMKWQVDRRAIAGAIAWEALENWSIMGGKIHHGIRAVGLGKVHIYNSKIPIPIGDLDTADQNTVAKQVEDRGYLPKQATLADRKAILATPLGAIDYIGAIMRAFSDLAATYGFSIDKDPIILTNLFQGKDLDSWEARLKEKAAAGDRTLAGGNKMDIWVGKYMRYIEDGVGPCELR